MMLIGWGYNNLWQDNFLLILSMMWRGSGQKSSACVTSFKNSQWNNLSFQTWTNWQKRNWPCLRTTFYRIVSKNPDTVQIRTPSTRPRPTMTHSRSTWVSSRSSASHWGAFAKNHSWATVDSAASFCPTANRAGLRSWAKPATRGSTFARSFATNSGWKDDARIREIHCQTC